jgi:hypothetical protein
MVDQPIIQTQAPRRLIDQVTGIRKLLEQQRIPVADMSRSGSLETRQPTVSLSSDRARSGVVPLRIERLEGKIQARKIDGAANPVSGFRYFLDGSQRTIPVCRIGLTPVVAGLSAAGILYREPGRQPMLLGDSLRVAQTWIVPRASGDPHVDELIEAIESSDGQVVDPLVNANGVQLPDYEHLVGDYGRIISHAYEVAGRLRQQQEQDVLRQWAETTSQDDPDHWIVVDGRLLSNVPRAVGVVKELLTQHLNGGEAVSLFDLPQGHRTTAFRYVSTFREANPEGDPVPSTGRTMWYMRLWDASGMDARHSLIRIETAHDVDTSEQIDQISRWITAERLPRPTDDPRWPTLLYPIHYLERILKRRLVEFTTGWPSI